MARERSQVAQLVEGALWATGLALGIEAYRRYRLRRRRKARAGAEIVCSKCGESLTVGDFLDPTVTCACPPSNDQQMG